MVGHDKVVRQTFARRRVNADAFFIKKHLKKDFTLLDVGCGVGSLTLDLAKILKEGKVYGIDLALESLNEAIQSAQEKKVQNVSFSQADVHHLPFAEQTFDVVFCFAFLMHMKDPALTLKKMRGVLKDKGFIAASEPDFGSFILYPDKEDLLSSFQFRAELFEKAGADMYFGRKLFSHLQMLNPSKIVSSICPMQFSEKAVKDFLFYTINFWENSPLIQKALKENWVKKEYIEETIQKLKRYRKNSKNLYLSASWIQHIAYF